MQVPKKTNLNKKGRKNSVVSENKKGTVTFFERLVLSSIKLYLNLPITATVVLQPQVNSGRLEVNPQVLEGASKKVKREKERKGGKCKVDSDKSYSLHGTVTTYYD